MEDNREKKNSLRLEQIFDLACLAASYGILFLLPQKMDALFYLIFGVSAFLFCIGFFRLGFSFDTPEDERSELYAGLSYALFGILINAVGLYVISRDQGSGRSITIATLLMIEALVLFAMAGSGFKTPKPQRILGILFRAVAVCLVIFGVLFALWKQISTTSVIIAMMLLFESICLWKMGGSSNPSNALTGEIQVVPGLRVPIAKLKQEFAEVETQLGYPWIGKVKTIKQDSIIYGPSEDGFFIYGYYLYGRFYVSGSTNPLFPNPGDALGHTVKEIPDSNGALLAKEDLPRAYARMFARYADSGDIQWEAELLPSGENE